MSLKFWLDGKLFTGIQDTADTGGQKFWFEGQAITPLYPTPPPGEGTTYTKSGIAIAGA